MKLSQKIYCYIIIAIGAIVGFFCIRHTIHFFSTSQQLVYDIISLVFLTGIYIACNCLPLYINENLTIDMTFMVIVAMIMTYGYTFAVFVIILATPFYYEKDIKTDKVNNIFNMPPIKTFFNLANFIIATALAGWVFKALGGTFGTIELPQVLLPYLGLVVAMVFVNTVMLLTLFYIQDKKAILFSLFDAFRSFIVNMFAAAPIGFFFAILLNLKGGIYLSALFTIPMLLARYAFKLYIKSKIQYEEMIRAFAKTIEIKDPYTIGHSVRVERYCLAIGMKMGLLPSRLERLKVAALLHDIGKIGIDDRILNKPSTLTGIEREQIQTHPDKGTRILENVTIDKNILQMIQQHHERYDSKGYPGHVPPNEILLESSIISVADAFDAMTSDRPYRDGMACERAFEIINEESGKQFNPKVAEVFLQIKEEVVALYEELHSSEDVYSML
jgi:putative nucleotidyltransferase with HDIG domain